MNDKCYALYIQSKILNFVAHLSKSNFFYYISSSVTSLIWTESNFSPVDQLNMRMFVYYKYCILFAKENVLY